MTPAFCWYCYWGWAAPVAAIYNRHKYEDWLDFGPGHVVWSDENFDDWSIRFCLEECDKVLGTQAADDDEDRQRAEITKQSLLELLEIPESVRCCQPDGYDGKHPENYPPQCPVEKRI